MTILLPVNGILLGPIYGTIATLLGVGTHLLLEPESAIFGPYSILLPVAATFMAGLLSKGRWREATMLFVSLIVAWYFLPTAREVWMLPYLHVITLVAIIVLRNQWEKLLSHLHWWMPFGLFVVASASVLTDHLVGNIVAVWDPLGVLRWNIPASAFYNVILLYAVERLSVALVATVISTTFIYLFLTVYTPMYYPTFATRALFLGGLTKPIDQYRVIAILIKGNIRGENIIQDVMSRLEPNNAPILLLGPTAPTQLSLSEDIKVGWVTSVSDISDMAYRILSPENATETSIFLTKTLKSLPEDMKPVILGDFLDNMIPHMSESLFYKYYSGLASNARVANYTAVFVVKADIHSEININVVKRFADVIIENRESEKKGKLIREVRVSNLVDNIHTDWEKY